MSEFNHSVLVALKGGGGSLPPQSISHRHAPIYEYM